MIVDIIIIVALLGGFLMGYKRGLIVQLFYLATIVIGYIVSSVFTSRLAYLFYEAFPIPSNLTAGLENTLKGINIPAGYYKVISFFLIIILVKIIIQVISSMLGIVRKLPLIKTTDKILGSVFGFVEVYLIIFVIVYLTTVLPLPELKNTMFVDAKIPKLVFEQTPILSKNLINLFFEYTK